MGLHTSLNHTTIFLSGWSFFLFNQIKSHSSFAVDFVASLPRRKATSSVDDNCVDRGGGSSTLCECFGKGSPVFSRVTAHYYSCHRKREFHAHIPDSSDGTGVNFTNYSCPLKMTYWYRSLQFFKVLLPQQALITWPFSERSLSFSDMDCERFSLLPYSALTLRRHSTDRQCVGTTFVANMRAAVKSLENYPSRTSLYRWGPYPSRRLEV